MRIRKHLSPPLGVLLQFQEKGSYRLIDVLQYMEWILDRSRADLPRGADGAEPRGAGGAEPIYAEPPELGVLVPLAEPP